MTNRIAKNYASVYKDMVKLCELFCKDELAGLDMVGA